MIREGKCAPEDETGGVCLRNQISVAGSRPVVTEGPRTSGDMKPWEVQGQGAEAAPVPDLCPQY